MYGKLGFPPLQQQDRRQHTSLYLAFLFAPPSRRTRHGTLKTALLIPTTRKQHALYSHSLVFDSPKSQPHVWEAWVLFLSPEEQDPTHSALCSGFCFCHKTQHRAHFVFPLVFLFPPKKTPDISCEPAGLRIAAPTHADLEFLFSSAPSPSPPRHTHALAGNCY